MELRAVAWSSTSRIVLRLVSGTTSPAPPFEENGRATGALARFREASVENFPVENSIAGKNTSMLVPRPGSLSTSIVPPASLTMRCTVARPRPVPSPGFFVVKKGSNSRARLRIHPAAVVFYHQRDGAPRSAGLSFTKFSGKFRRPRVQSDLSAMRHRVAPVQYQVQQDLPQLRRISEHPPGAGVERGVKRRVKHYDQFNLFADQPPQQIFR